MLSSLYNDIMADLLAFQKRCRNTRWRPPRKRCSTTNNPWENRRRFCRFQTMWSKRKHKTQGVAYFYLSASALFSVYTRVNIFERQLSNFPSRKSDIGSVFQLKLPTWKWENLTSRATECCMCAAGTHHYCVPANEPVKLTQVNEYLG